MTDSTPRFPLGNLQAGHVDTDGPSGQRTASHRWAGQAREFPREGQEKSAGLHAVENEEESGVQT